MKFVYTVWLMDLSLPNDDSECEWPASFIIDGTTLDSAKNWGDRVAERYAGDHGQRIVGSTIEDAERSILPGLDTLPTIYEGEEATDDQIGW